MDRGKPSNIDKTKNNSKVIHMIAKDTNNDNLLV